MVMFTRYGAVLLAGTLTALLVLAAQGVAAEGIAAAFLAAMIPLVLTESALARLHQRRWANLLATRVQQGDWVFLTAPGLAPVAVRRQDLGRAVTAILKSRHTSWRQRQHVLSTTSETRVLLLDLGDFIVLNIKPAGNRGHRIVVPIDQIARILPQ